MIPIQVLKPFTLDRLGYLSVDTYVEIKEREYEKISKNEGIDFRKLPPDEFERKRKEQNERPRPRPPIEELSRDSELIKPKLLEPHGVNFHQFCTMIGFNDLDDVSRDQLNKLKNRLEQAANFVADQMKAQRYILLRESNDGYRLEHESRIISLQGRPV